MTAIVAHSGKVDFVPGKVYEASLTQAKSICNYASCEVGVLDQACKNLRLEEQNGQLNAIQTYFTQHKLGKKILTLAEENVEARQGELGMCQDLLYMRTVIIWFWCHD